ncbi:MAG TPA: transglycosylase domain-containing protein, partial [Candidatus Cybelea sp.]|nr:transglycosylase domain-containing protein [Candidatus Cybelea sp.]
MKLFALAVPGGAFALMLALYLAGVNVAHLPPPSGSVTFTDRTGGGLGTVLGARSSHVVVVPLRDVSVEFLQAIVAAEDARFWHHGAVDVPALIRAARDFVIFGEARSGGSTIEMQLARLLHPTPSTFRGKLIQIAQAQRIAMVSSRPDILEAYVNRVPMGGNVYGVESAARTYFGEPASDLDLAQAALLAAIPNDPSRFEPANGWGALRARQHFVLTRMAALGLITPARAQLAFAETLNVRRHDSGIVDAAHAIFFLARGSRHEGRVRTTIDRDLQRFVQAQTQAVIAALQQYHVSDGAALVADNRTGAVLAYV